jgi:hypothetical protein
VLIPDFAFEKAGAKVYLEIVGFWTSDYLERKVSKLGSISGSGIDMIIVADESLACSKLERLRGRAPVIYYRREVPLKPIIDYLKEREASIIREQAERVKGEALSLKGDAVSLDELAGERGVTVDSMRIALRGFEPEGYARVGESFISREKLEEIGRRLEGIEKLTDALGLIEASGLKDGESVLDALGYTSVWEGMDMDKARIRKKAASTPRTDTA